MIGTRLVAAVAVASAAGMLVAPRVPDPVHAIEARRLVVERAVAAMRALDGLRAALGPAIDEGRAASTAIVSGGDAPEPAIERASEAVAGAQPAAALARVAVSRLNVAVEAWAPAHEPLAMPLPAGELGSISDQLRVADEAAGAFVDLRLRAVELPSLLDEAVAALDAGDVDAADDWLADAAAAHELVAEWEAAPSTLPVWLETTRAMIEGVSDLAAAVRAGDAQRAEAAAEGVEALAEDADEADRALRIALSEGGAGIIGVPLGRLADVARRTEAARAAAAVIAEAGGS